MGGLLDRNRELARRCGDLSPIAPAVRDILWQGNRAVVMAGVSPGTTRQVPVTWRQGHADNQWCQRPGQRPFLMIGYTQAGRGPARAPQGEASRIIAGCEVVVDAGPAKLVFLKSWPGLGDVAGYIEYGTEHCPPRPFMGYRQIELEAVGNLLRQHVLPRGVLGRLAGLFGR